MKPPPDIYPSPLLVSSSLRSVAIWPMFTPKWQAASADLGRVETVSAAWFCQLLGLVWSGDRPSMQWLHQKRCKTYQGWLVSMIHKDLSLVKGMIKATSNSSDFFKYLPIAQNTSH